MNDNIGANFYCSADTHKNKSCSSCELWDESTNNCKNLHRKYPSPEQYKEEYGEDVPDDMLVWVLERGYQWLFGIYKWAKDFHEDCHVVIACTPFPRPDDNWRPK